MNLDHALHTFIAESRELLADMEASLLHLQPEAPSPDAIHAIFRAAHTIKGSAGLFGLDHVVAFTHVAETLLDQVRAACVPLDAGLIELLLACCDHMHALVNVVEAHGAIQDPQLQARSDTLVQALHARSLAPSKSVLPPQTATPDLPAETDAPSCAWQIAARFGPAVLQNGMDPLSFLRYLHTLGRITHTELLSQAVPNLQQLDAEQCYLGFVVHLHGHASQQEVESVFDFVRDECELQVTPLASPHAAPCPAQPSAQDSAGGDKPPARALPHAPPSNTWQDLAQVNVVPSAEALPSASASTTAPRQGEHASLRVDAHKLEQLINLVGELITASAGATEVARQLRHSEMLEATATVAALVEQVRDHALQLRMVKIGGSFNKFQRIVHDVARELGKDIALHISGQDTELDKTVVERIGDPLTHLVRNAIDHGIEPAAVRLANGKPAQGSVYLDAHHESGHIVIEIRDDGAGLDRERILAKAVERGLIEPGRQLADNDIDALIFEPGFSTATQITSLSGRGVGMDVVRSNITALRGTVEVRSVPGQGTTVQVRLPLTLAIIDGFQVRVGHSVFVIPLEMVDECVEYLGTPAQHYTDLRGTVLPFIRLRQHFALQGPGSARPNIVVIQHGTQRFGLLVDELLGEAQAVIKPLSRIFRQARGISGSSILGNGKVALILDIAALHQQVLTTRRRETIPFTTTAP